MPVTTRRRFKGMSLRRRTAERPDATRHASAYGSVGEASRHVKEEVGKDGLSGNHNPRAVPIMKSNEYHEGTCGALFSRVNDWYKPKKWNRIGLLEGKKGSGKTVFMSVLSKRGSPTGFGHGIPNIPEAGKKPIPVAAFYFFTTFDKPNMGVTRMLRSLADQMAKTIPEYGVKLKEMELDKSELRKLDPENLFLKIIAEPLKNVTKEKMIVVIDALNECFKNFREQIIRIIKDLWVEHTPDWLGVLVSGSTRTYVINKLRNAEFSEIITVEDEHVIEDTKLYFKAVLETSTELTGFRDIEAGAEALSKNTNGVFLYCEFALQLLDRRGYTLENMENLPYSADNVVRQYVSMLQKELEIEKIDYFKTMIAPLVVCRAPIPLTEWRAICEEPDSVAFKAKYQRFQCMIYVRENLVRLKHNSIARLLEDAHDGKIRIEKEEAHRRMATWCESHCENNNSYAMSHVIYHLCAAGKLDDARNKLLSFDWNFRRLTLQKGYERHSNATNVEEALDDAFLVYLKRRQEDRDVQVVQGAIERGRVGIASDIRQLASQLLGRIGRARASADLKQLLDDAAQFNPKQHWWEPVNPSLNRSDGSLQKTIADNLNSVNSIAVSPDGSLMASAASDGYIRIYETLRGRCLFTFDEHRIDEGAALQVAFSYHAKDLLLASCARDQTGGTVKIWRPKLGELKQNLRFRKIVNALHFGGTKIDDTTDDNDIPVNLLLTGSVDKIIRIFNVVASSTYPIRVIHHQSSITDLKFSPHFEDQIAVASKDGQVTLYDWKSGMDHSESSPGRVMNVLGEHKESCTALAFHPKKNYLISVSADNDKNGIDNCVLWDLDSEEQERVRGYNIHSVAIKSVSFTPDGSHFATADLEGAICITQLDPKAEEVNYSERADEVTILNDRKRRLLEGDLGRFLDAKVVYEKAHDGGVNCVCFFPNKSNLKFASCSLDLKIKVWSYDPLDLAMWDPTHKVKVIAMEFSPSGNKICTTDNENKCVIWDVEEGKWEANVTLKFPATKVKFFDDRHIQLTVPGDNVMLSLPNENSTVWKLNKRNPAQVNEAIRSVPLDVTPNGAVGLGDDGIGFTTDNESTELVEKAADLARGMPNMIHVYNRGDNTQPIYACICEGSRVHILRLRRYVPEEITEDEN